jgi:hypothetical protein
MAFDPTDHEDKTSVLTQVENSVSDIRIWVVENKLKFNDHKTGVFILTSKVVVGIDANAPTPTVRNLGAMFDQSLTMDDFVKHICKAAYFHLHNSSSIRNCLTKSLPSHLYILLSVAGWTTARPCYLA